MLNLSRVVIWICKRFNREQIKLIIEELKNVLKYPDSEIQPRDTFKEDNPNYRKFDVDPNPPLKEVPKKKLKKTTKSYWKNTNPFTTNLLSLLSLNQASWPYPRSSTALPARLRISLFISMMARDARNWFAKSASLHFISINGIEWKINQALNYSALIVSTPFINGKNKIRSLSTNAEIKIVLAEFRIWKS